MPARMEHDELIAAQHLRSLEEQRARSFAWWALVPMFSGGMLACAPFAVAAHRTGRQRYRVAAGVWLALAIAAVTLLALGGHGRGAVAVIGGLVVLLNAVGGAAHTLAIRGDYARELTAAEDPSLLAAQRSAQRRERGRELARRDPARALELGVGRPDLPDSFDAGLIDVNHAPAEVLERLPGIDPRRARRIVELRMNGTGFRSAEDLDMALDLEPGALAELARRAVFLPRG